MGETEALKWVSDVNIITESWLAAGFWKPNEILQIM
jgi:hypothetical protein